MTIYLVSCVSQKLDQAAPARELYCSDWFKKARAYVESTGQPWFILSARFGLVRPEQVLEPYDLSLMSLSAGLRERWAYRVGYRILTDIGPIDQQQFVLLAGRDYREALQRWAGIDGECPMAGLALGQQKRWLADQLAKAEGLAS